MTLREFTKTEEASEVKFAAYFGKNGRKYVAEIEGMKDNCSAWKRSVDQICGQYVWLYD